jgi:hypothetical protein
MYPPLLGRCHLHIPSIPQTQCHALPWVFQYHKLSHRSNLLDVCTTSRAGFTYGHVLDFVYCFQIIQFVRIIFMHGTPACLLTSAVKGMVSFRDCLQFWFNNNSASPDGLQRWTSWSSGSVSSVAESIRTTSILLTRLIRICYQFSDCKWHWLFKWMLFNYAFAKINRKEAI